jgi:predicted DNA-binding protein with PD1-like motif
VFVAESRRSRRLVGRLDRGADLVAEIVAVCRAHGVRSAEVRALGSLEEVELRPGAGATRRFVAPLTIVHLEGVVAEEQGALRVDAACALSRDRDDGIELLGGRLVQARALAVEFVIDAFDDLVLRRAADDVTGLPSLVGAEPAPEEIEEPTPIARPAPPAFEAPARGRVATPGAAAAVDTAPSWAEVARHSAARPPVEEEVVPDGEDDEPLRSGDVIEHPRFGRCEVERIEGDSEYAQVRLRNRRLVRLSLDVLQLVREGQDEKGARRYRAQVQR